MITRQQMMLDSKSLHSPYYQQFVTNGTSKQVESMIRRVRGLKADAPIVKLDEHWNDIPLIEWDRLVGYTGSGSRIPSWMDTPTNWTRCLFVNLDTWKAVGNEGFSGSDLVCIAKAAANLIVEKG